MLEAVQPRRRSFVSPRSGGTDPLDRHGLEILSDDECLELLTRAPVGRLGFSSGALPVIFPVNIEVQGRRAYFRAADGVKLRAARNHAVACLQVDDYDALEHRGWSVLATGRLHCAEDEAASVTVRPWASTIEGELVCLDIELVSGRGIGTHAPLDAPRSGPSQRA